MERMKINSNLNLEPSGVKREKDSGEDENERTEEKGAEVMAGGDNMCGGRLQLDRGKGDEIITLSKRISK